MRYRRRLPHWHPDGKHIFVTWRLWGSLPAWKQTPIETPGQAFVAMDRILDRRADGPLWLRDPRVASLVTNTLCAGDHERRFYALRAWVIMPNHVHALILPDKPLQEITRWIKGSTACAANRLLARTGQPFWQDESFDHWVRDQWEYDRIVRYIEWNPVSAGLIESPELWEWSSADKE